MPRIDGLTDLVEVGRGGFGVVYRARDERFSRDVAVKIIRDSGNDPDIKARFERESRALGGLSGHPNIVAVYDSGVTEDGDFYLVMEYLPGGSLGDLLRKSGPPPLGQLAAWGASLAGALETAHRAGIVHRDVKPENVLFSDYGVPKLVDFGIARMRSAFETRTGFMSATLAHAAPEVVAGSAATPAADVYALASVLHTLASGRTPFEREGEESLAPLLSRIALGTPPDLRAHGVTDPLASIIEKGLAKEPSERFDSAAAFAAALMTATEPGSTAPVVLGRETSASAVENASTADTEPLPGETVVVPIKRAAKVADTDAASPSRRGRKKLLVAAIVAGTLLLGSGAVYASTLMGGPSGPADADGLQTPPATPQIPETTEPDPTVETEEPTDTPTPEPTSQTPAGSPPRITGDSVTTDEQRDVSVSFTASGSGVTVKKLSGPSWLKISGSKVTGFVPHSAATGRSPKTFTVRLEAKNQYGTDTTDIRITVRDTHFTFPNYAGKYGDGSDGLPKIHSIVSPKNFGCRADGRTAGTIYSTNPKAGAIVKYGQSVSFWYVNPGAADGLCSAVAK